MHNEQTAIAATVKDFKSHLPDAKVIVVDNGSTDNTHHEVRTSLDSPNDIIITEKRVGKGFALKAAIQRLPADIYLFTDGDATYSGKDGKMLVDKLIDKRCDMVVGDRLSNGSYAKQNIRIGHNLGNRLFTRIISILANKVYCDVFSGLRAISAPAMSALCFQTKSFQVETEINVCAAFFDFDVIEVPINYSKRRHGTVSKLNSFKDGVKILVFALGTWIKFAPKQFFGIVAAVSLLFAFFASYRVIAGFLETGWTYSTTAVAAATFGLTSVLAIFFGICITIVVSNHRHQQIAAFLEKKRDWNSVIDTYQCFGASKK